MDDQEDIQFNFSEITEKHESTELPAEWLNCARKSTIIAGKFIAFKTPLDGRFNKHVSGENRWTCTWLIKNMKDSQQKLGLVIDLTDTYRYYLSKNEFIDKGIRHEKIQCSEDDDEIPNDDQITRFIQVCRDFISTNPNDIIGVHCTYGYNLTGFLICAYLCRELYFNVHNAINWFTNARSPGISKPNYLRRLVQKFDINSLRSTQIHSGIIPAFAVNHPNIVPITSGPLLQYIRSKCQKMCESNGQYFPGSKLVSMNSTNYETILKSSYMVSWKADGTRYLMLIDGEDRIYMLDRNNDVFEIKSLRFPDYKDVGKHLTDTLIDGEFVTDHDHTGNIYRYLVFDIIRYEYHNVGQQTYHERLDKIRNDIVTARNNAMAQGFIDQRSQSFSIRAKQFCELSKASDFLNPDFLSKITHGCDGLIFQPVNLPYRSGRSSDVLKWDTNNTVDFRLEIKGKGQSQDKTAFLYVQDMPNSFASMRYSPDLDQYNNQIIECLIRNNQWSFYRSRRDRKYPNKRATAEGIIQASKTPISKEILYSLIEQSKAFSTYE